MLIGRCDVDLKILDGLGMCIYWDIGPTTGCPSSCVVLILRLLPFVNNELTVNANPLKLREYLAAGLPVIASPIPEVARYKGW